MGSVGERTCSCFHAHAWAPGGAATRRRCPLSSSWIGTENCACPNRRGDLDACNVVDLLFLFRSSFRVVWLASLYHRSNRVNKSRGENHNSGQKPIYLTGTDVHYDGAEASKYDAVWASADRASLTPWESFVRGTFGYSLVDRGNASADVRTGRFLATYLEPVVMGLEWVPKEE